MATQPTPVFLPGESHGQRSLAGYSSWDHRKHKGIPGNIYFCFIDYARAFDCVDYNKLWKILQEMGIPDHLTCRLRNLYAGQEATQLELDMEQRTGSILGKE